MADKTFIAKFLKGSAFTSLGTIVSIVFHFLSIKLLAEYMDPEAFGIYTLVIIIAHGTQILGGLGLNLSLVKSLSGDLEGDRNEAVSTIFLARFLQLSLLSVVVFGAGHLFLPRLFGEEIGAYILFVPPIVFLASFRELLFHLLQGVQLFNRYALINIVSAFIRLSSIAYFSFYGTLTVETMIVVEFITYGISFLLLVFFSPIIRMLTWQLSRTTVKHIASFSAPLYANDILTFIYNKVSILFIASMLTPVSVARFEMAGKIPEGFGRLFSSLIVVYFPSISELLAKGEKQQAVQFMNRGVILATTILSMVTLVTFLFRKEIVLLLFSEQYVDASMALALFMLNFTLSAVARIMGYTVVADGHSSVPVRINLIASVANIVGCMLLIPPFGFIGAIYSLIIMSTISQLLNYYFLVKAEIGADLWGFFRPILVLIGIALIYASLRNEAYALRGVTILLYALVSWFLIPEVKQAALLASRYLNRFTWKPT